MFVCIVAACGGLLYGYANAVNGGVTAMPDFQAKFFPNVSCTGNATGCAGHVHRTAGSPRQLLIALPDMYQQFNQLQNNPHAPWHATSHTQKRMKLSPYPQLAYIPAHQGGYTPL